MTPDYRTWEQVQLVAKEARALAVDWGPGRYPRYEVIVGPQVGDLVSESFNGDYRSAGEVVSVSPSGRVVTVESDGCRRRFWRRRLTGSWYCGIWGLVPRCPDRDNLEV